MRKPMSRAFKFCFQGIPTIKSANWQNKQTFKLDFSRSITFTSAFSMHYELVLDPGAGGFWVKVSSIDFPIIVSHMQA